MSAEEVFYFAAIVLIGFPASFYLGRRHWWLIGVRNPTALAMVVTWFAGRLAYEEWGDLSTKAKMGIDIIVIAAMLMKSDWRICSYKTARLQIAAMWRERTPWDQAILALFPAVWIFYFPVIGARSQYWILYGLSFAQLVLAGWEAISTKGRSANQPPADTSEHPSLRLDYSMGRGAYG